MALHLPGSGRQALAVEARRGSRRLRAGSAAHAQPSWAAALTKAHEVDLGAAMLARETVAGRWRRDDRRLVGLQAQRLDHGHGLGLHCCTACVRGERVLASGGERRPQWAGLSAPVPCPGAPRAIPRTHEQQDGADGAIAVSLDIARLLRLLVVGRLQAGHHIRLQAVAPGRGLPHSAGLQRGRAGVGKGARNLQGSRTLVDDRQEPLAAHQRRCQLAERAHVAFHLCRRSPAGS